MPMSIEKKPLLETGPLPIPHSFQFELQELDDIQAAESADRDAPWRQEKPQNSKSMLQATVDLFFSSLNLGLGGCVPRWSL